jgi:hypothetical protein
MKRYTSPTGQMEENENGGFITLADHENAMSRVPLSFEAHMGRHFAFEYRAAAIVIIFREEHAIDGNLFFGGFGSTITNGTMIRLMLEDGVSGIIVAHIDVPFKLFEVEGTAAVVVAARQHKAKMDEQRELARLDRVAKQEAEEREQALLLLAKYPDLVDRKAAERYHWLRDDPPLELAVRQHPGETERGRYLDGPSLDAAIDAELAKKGDAA